MPEPAPPTTSATSRCSAGRQQCKVRFNWHTLNFRYKTVDSYFGTSSTPSTTRGRRSPLIKAKKVVLKNDYIHHVIDIYHI